jgi:sugar O-acyltransferase (sialic acid O-acetyltransferase NeuD family)
MSRDFAIFGLVGAGGFAREVMPYIKQDLAQTRQNCRAVYIDIVDTPRVVNDAPVISEKEFFESESVKYFNVAIDNPKLRKSISQKYIEMGGVPKSIIASNSIFLDSNTIEPGAIFCTYSMVTANAKIGKFFHANIYSYVAHDCLVGDFVTFAPGVKCNGNVVIEDGVYVGTGAVIKQGTSKNPIVIGSNAIVGMGAVVTKNVEPNQTVVGNPARPIVRK